MLITLGGSKINGNQRKKNIYIYKCLFCAFIFDPSTGLFVFISARSSMHIGYYL